jgi:hypothetical protein
MKKMASCLFLTISFLAAGASQAGVVSGSGVIAGEQVDEYRFTTSGSGQVTISTTETDKPPVRTDEAYDTVLFLYRDDGSLDASDFIQAGTNNPSTGDSVISMILDAGKYLLAVATHGASGTRVPIVGGHAEHDHTDYTLTINGQFVTPNQVPEPGSLALFGLGLIGLAALTKRKQA